MNTVVAIQVEISPPPIVIINWGRSGGVGVGVQMHKRTTPKIFARAKQLHREMTPAETKLWAHLRAHRTDDVHFRNQYAIGNYIADFCAPRKKLVIELDGSQHLEQEEYDEERIAYLRSKGYKVLRFWNNDVMKDIDSVLHVIYSTLNDPTSL
jgi:very-short-patch-repair endonuclease